MVTTADTPTRADVDVWRGDGAPNIVWQFTDFDLSGSTFELTVYQGPAELLSLSSDDDELEIDVAASQVIWPKTSEQTALIPFGPSAQYKLRRVMLGDRQTLAFGYLIGQGGNTFDV